jgi:hypothetical protein
MHIKPIGVSSQPVSSREQKKPIGMGLEVIETWEAVNMTSYQARIAH